MIGVILAGGTGSRLRPLTNVTNKHLLPIYDKPMVYYPISLLKGFGLSEIIITTGKEFGGDFTDLLGDGSRYGVNFTYKVQEKALGIAHALGLVKNIANGNPVIVVLGDNFFMFDEQENKDIREIVSKFMANPQGAVIFTKEVEDPERFGVAEFDKNGNVIGIEEKPQRPRSKAAVTGMYLYDKTIFEKISGLKPSGRGELELTDVNNAYIREGRLRCHKIKGEWTDAGTFESLYKASTIVKNASDKTS